jgi:hypothetical protein
MAKLKNKKEIGTKTVVELTVERGIYMSENGLIHHNCNECLRLHMMPDGVTPLTWKLSQLSMNYHKRGENNPSVSGEHPGCRCSIAYLPEGWGFKNGYVSFISLDHDEYKSQRGLD